LQQTFDVLRLTDVTQKKKQILMAASAARRASQRRSRGYSRDLRNVRFLVTAGAVVIEFKKKNFLLERGEASRRDR